MPSGPESPSIRERLTEVFGPRALRSALFYHHAPALRFELSRGGGYVTMFTQAYDRGRELLDAIFRGSDEITVVLSFLSSDRLLGRLSVFRSLRDCDIEIGRPREVWTEDTDEDDWAEDGETWTFVAFRAEKEALHRLLWGAVAAEIGVHPRLLCSAHLADPDRGVLAHPYDDRGMDVIGSDHAFLRELYARFNPYLLDYDRAAMDAWFGAGTDGVRGSGD